MSQRIRVIAAGLASAAAIVLSASQSAAAPVVPVSATASSAASGFGASFAIDQGASKLATDWAAGFTGAGSFITFDLGSSLPVDQIVLTDRTTGGASNGTAAYGTGDFTTRYQVQLSNTATFSSVLYTYTSPTLATPVNPVSASAFQTTVSFSPVSAEFVRYTVLAANGVAPGLADASFDVAPLATSTPEPTSLLLLSVGVALCGIRRRR